MRKLMTTMMMTIALGVLAAAQTKTADQMKAMAADAKTAPSAAGTWNMTVDTPHGAMVMKAELKLDGKKITGTLSNDMIGSHDLAGEMADGRVTFKFTTDMGDMEFNGKLKDADSLVGTLTSTSGDMACSGTRVKGK